VSKRVKVDYESSAPRAAAAYARGATSTRIDGKPSASHSAPLSVPMSRQIKQADYESSVPSHSKSKRPTVRLRARSVALGWGSPPRRWVRRHSHSHHSLGGATRWPSGLCM